MRKDTWYLSAEGAGTCAEGAGTCAEGAGTCAEGAGTCAEGAGTCAEGARFVEYVLWAEGPLIVAFFFS